MVKLELRKIQKMTGSQLKKHLDQQLLNELNPEIKLIIMINYLTTRVLTPFDRARVIFRNSSIIELGKPRFEALFPARVDIDTSNNKLFIYFYCILYFLVFC